MGVVRSCIPKVQERQRSIARPLITIKKSLEMNIPKIFIFNFFTRQSFEKADTLQVLGQRLNSMSLDFSFILGMVFPFLAISFVPSFYFIATSNVVNVLLPIWFGFIPFTFLSFLIINKDFFNAKSIAKRHFGYQIVDSKSNLPANELQCVIRNSTMIIWPLEVVVSMFNSEKRIGDFLAGTKLVKSGKEAPELIMTEIHQKKNINNKSKLIWLLILIAFMFNVLSVLPILLTVL